MVHMPIMFRGGDGKDVCIGCLSHVIKRAACRYILGGFPSPTVNNVPKALGLMQFLAAALSLAHDRIQTCDLTPSELHPPTLKLSRSAKSDSMLALSWIMA
ncbi:hypothetical protein CYMTET_35556 [Cymbomonas tetramitiformis]|uniref:Uncharacterized protein n=2 Tax=Cymbomonas tetramitiformis TaxID=36881 RepID=A0AAE0F8Y8_9CHLO|nr:hypothetical protein CYMTET_35556 [Cymbomonas tetramitiformis]